MLGRVPPNSGQVRRLFVVCLLVVARGQSACTGTSSAAIRRGEVDNRGFRRRKRGPLGFLAGGTRGTDPDRPLIVRPSPIGEREEYDKKKKCCVLRGANFLIRETRTTPPQDQRPRGEDGKSFYFPLQPYADCVCALGSERGDSLLDLVGLRL